MSENRWNDYYIYDESSPTCLRWKVNRYGGQYYKTIVAKAGNCVGTLWKGKYYHLLFMKKGYRVHNIIWEMFNGAIPSGMEVDHKNGNGLDNKISNLRLVSRTLNSRNRKKRSDNTSGKTGVNFIDSGEGFTYWRVYWTDEKGVLRRKNFSIKRLGDLAFKEACDFRDKVLVIANTNGAGYTERHGT